jgi:hypothetical protein
MVNPDTADEKVSMCHNVIMNKVCALFSIPMADRSPADMQ